VHAVFSLLEFNKFDGALKLFCWSLLLMQFVLQELMKDQFGNYVVQKVLETCDDKYLEMILSSIKLHLNELKNYTYGKHIVARVEKLIVTGGKQTASNLYVAMHNNPAHFS
jgi:hypothetical protein